MNGISSYEKLAYGILNMITGEMLSLDEGEAVFNELLSSGEDWGYHDGLEDSIIKSCLENLDDRLSNLFFEEEQRFSAENENLRMIREQRIRNIFIPRIEKHEQILQNLIDNDIQRLIPARRGLIKSAKEGMARQLEQLEKKSAITPEFGYVALGIFINSFS